MQTAGAALQRLWLCTPLATLFVLVWLVPTVVMVRIERWWDAIQRDMGQEYRPWILENDTQQMFLLFLFASTCVLTLLLLLRAMGSGRGRVVCVWPAQCARCGYHLPGMTADQSCPECGTLVGEAIGDHREAPACQLWQSGWTMATPLLFLFGPLYRSRVWGEKLRLYDPDPSYRRSLLIHAGLAVPLMYGMATITIVSVGVTEWLDSGSTRVFRNIWRDLDEVLLVCLFVGMLWSVGLVLVTIAISSSFGIMASWFFKLNLLPAAAQAGAYVAGLLNLTIVLGWLAVLVIGITNDYFDWVYEVSRYLRVDQGVLLLGLMIAAGVPVLWRYVYCLSRMTLAMRFSNR